MINVPTGITTRTEALEVYVVDACLDEPTQPPAGARSMSSWRRGEPTQPLPGTLPERFGVLVLARGSDCAVVGARCVMATRDDARVVVDLLATTGPACASCDAGRCVMTMPDAGGLDAGVDAGSDGGVDAAPDARVVTPEERCDCVDDDVDLQVDEGCASSGGGTVRWQSTFDGPGDQNLRSLVMGGDGRLYSSGWMNAGASATCAGALEGGGMGRSWTLGFNATTGACETSVQRDAMESAPFASVWRGARGVWMYAPGTLLEIVGGTSTPHLMLMPGAYFDAGHVRQIPGAEGLLLSYRVWAELGVETTVGTYPRFTNTGGSVVVLASSEGAPTVTSVGLVNRDGHSARMPDGRVAVIHPNAPLAVAAPCVVDDAPASRVEIRSASALDGCVRAFGTDFVTRDSELQTYVTGSTLWVVRSAAFRVAVRAIDLSTDDATARELDLGTLPQDFSPAVILAPAPDGTLFVGSSTSAGGYVMHLRADPGGITVLGQRWTLGHVIGLDVGTDGTVYVMSTADAPTPLCPSGGVPREPFTPMGSGRVITALDFGL